MKTNVGTWNEKKKRKVRKGMKEGKIKRKKIKVGKSN